MTFKLSNTVKSVALAGALGLAGLAATATTASAHYNTTRCYGDRCEVLRCDYDGDGCYTVSSYYRGYGYHRGYGRARWVCDYDGDDCHWVYGHGYRHSPHYSTHIGIGLGIHD